MNDEVRTYTPDDLNAFDNDLWTALEDHAVYGNDDQREDLDVPPKYPLTRDVDDDADWDTRLDADVIPDPEAAQEHTERMLEYSLSHGRAVFVIPQWMASDDGMGWEAVFVGDYEGLTQSGKAHKLANIRQWSKRNEDPYFADEIDFETIPVSMSEVFIVEKPEPSDSLVIAPTTSYDERDVSRGQASDADVTIEYVDYRARYGPKIVMDWAPPWGDTQELSEGIRSALKSMDWEEVHYSFNDEGSNKWRADATATLGVINQFVDNGYSVALTSQAETQILNDDGELGHYTAEMLRDEFDGDDALHI